MLYFDEDEELWIGGMFWDGRATGWTLGDPLAEQAQGPFLNNLEQNLPGAKQVIRRVTRSDYADLFEEVWGPGSLDGREDIAGLVKSTPSRRSMTTISQAKLTSPT